MNELTDNVCEKEHDFALIVDGVGSLTTDVEDALFNAGCDNATLSIQYGLLYMEFSRRARSLRDAIVSAIHDVRKAGIGAEVLRVERVQSGDSVGDRKADSTQPPIGSPIHDRPTRAGRIPASRMSSD